MKKTWKAALALALVLSSGGVSRVWAAPKDPFQILKSLYAKHLNPVLAESPDTGAPLEWFSPISVAMGEIREKLIQKVADDIQQIPYKQAAQRKARVLQWVRAIFESKERLGWRQNYWLISGSLGADFLGYHLPILAPLRQVYAEDMHQALHELFDTLRKEKYSVGQILVMTKMFAVLRPTLDQAGYPGTEDSVLGWSQYHYPNIGDWLGYILLQTRDLQELREFIDYALWVEATFPGIVVRSGLTERLFLSQSVQKHMKKLGIKPHIYKGEICNARMARTVRP